MFDIKEWEDDPDDLLLGWQVYKNAVYLLQRTMSKAYIKVITPDYTYVYDFGSYTYVDFGGSKTNYGLFEVLDETTIIYGHVYFDLTNLLVFIMGQPTALQYNIELRNYLPIMRSVKKINGSSWILSDSAFGHKRSTTISLFQRTSFMNCLKCADKVRILETMGFTERLKNIHCEDYDIGNVRGYNIGDSNDRKIKNANLSSMSISQGMFGKNGNEKGEQIKPTYDIRNCLSNFRKLTVALNSKTQTSEVQNYYKQLSTNCNPNLMKVFVDYVVAYYKAKHLHSDFIQKFYERGTDMQALMDTFFKEAKAISEYVEIVTYGITKLAGSLKDTLDGLKSIFQSSFLWGVLYFKLYEDQYKNPDETWKEVNPYSDLVKVNFDDFYSTIVQAMAGIDADYSFPFPIRKISMKKKTKESRDVTYYSLGPAGCVSRIDFKELPFGEFDNIVDIETLEDGTLLMWTWIDINGFANRGNQYMINTLYEPQYVIRIYRLNPKTKEVKKVYEEDVPENWHMLDNRKMAVVVSKDKTKLYIRDYFLPTYDFTKLKKLDYVEISKPLNEEMAKLLKISRGNYFNANINNIIFRMGGRDNLSVSPGFPVALAKPHDMSSKTNLTFAYPYDMAAQGALF